MSIIRSKYTGRIKVLTGYDALRNGSEHRREIARFGCPGHWLHNPGLYELDCRDSKEPQIRKLMDVSKGKPCLESLYLVCVQWIKQWEIYDNCKCGQVDMYVRNLPPPCSCHYPIGFKMSFNMEQVESLVGVINETRYIKSCAVWRRCGYQENTGPNHLPFHAPYGYTDDDIVDAVKREPELVREERRKRRDDYAARHGESEAHRMFDVMV